MTSKLIYLVLLGLVFGALSAQAQFALASCEKARMLAEQAIDQGKSNPHFFVVDATQEELRLWGEYNQPNLTLIHQYTNAQIFGAKLSETVALVVFYPNDDPLEEAQEIVQEISMNQVYPWQIAPVGLAPLVELGCA
jgi:hypothetical protein